MRIWATTWTALSLYPKYYPPSEHDWLYEITADDIRCKCDAIFFVNPIRMCRRIARGSILAGMGGSSPHVAMAVLRGIELADQNGVIQFERRCGPTVRVGRCIVA